jgi:hypothetical protein
MNSQEAKAILLLYRAGVDQNDPQFAAALSLAEHDPELRAWLKEQDASFNAVRRKFSEIDVPKDLREKIVRQRPIPLLTARWRRPALQIAAGLVILAGLAIFWPRPGVKNNFAAYEHYLVKLVSGKYRMSLETDNQQHIRSFLERNQAPSDYEVPQAVGETRALGCATLSWSGNPVSMLCFVDAQNRKLWLFVTSPRSIPDSPKTAVPSFATQAKGFVTASWTANGHTYVLTMQGSAGDLDKYL